LSNNNKVRHEDGKFYIILNVAKILCPLPVAVYYLCAVNKILRNALQILIFFGLGTTVMTLVYRSQNAAFQEQCRLDHTPAGQCILIDKLWNDFASADIWWLLAVVAAFTVSNLFRAWRWQMLLEPLGYQVKLKHSFWTIILGYFANLFFPRIGEVARAGALARCENIPTDRVLGTLIVDRLIDFLCLGLVVGLAFVFELDTLLKFIEQQRGNGTSGGLLSQTWVQIVLVLGGTGLIAAYFLRTKIMATAIGKKVAGFLTGLMDGLRSVMRMRQPVVFILYSLGIWLMFYLQCYFGLKAFAPTAHLTAGAALMVFVFGTLGFVVPSPGGMGTYHLLCMAGLSLYGISSIDGFSYANISFFTIQILYNFVFGLTGLALLWKPLFKK
jgi:glycosyltransferase 2 family protein